MSDSSDLEESWIEWFCGLSGNEFFCEIDRSYIEDSFNLYGLRNVVSNYQNSINVILDLIDRGYEDDLPPEVVQLYGLIHARYIITPKGLDAMARKFRNAEFGCCPRALCNGSRVVPAGMFDECGKSEVKVFCPKCQDIYTPIMEVEYSTSIIYEDFKPSLSTKIYRPKVFGYRIHNQQSSQVRSRNEEQTSTERNSRTETKDKDKANHQLNGKNSKRSESQPPCLKKRKT